MVILVICSFVIIHWKPHLGLPQFNTFLHNDFGVLFFTFFLFMMAMIGKNSTLNCPKSTTIMFFS